MFLKALQIERQKQYTGRERDRGRGWAGVTTRGAVVVVFTVSCGFYPDGHLARSAWNILFFLLESF